MALVLVIDADRRDDMPDDPEPPFPSAPGRHAEVFEDDGNSPGNSDYFQDFRDAA